MLRHLTTSWHLNIWNFKIWSSRSEIKTFFLVSQVLSFMHTKENSKNVAETTFKDFFIKKQFTWRYWIYFQSEQIYCQQVPFLWFCLDFVLLNSHLFLCLFRWGTHLNMSLFLSVHPSVCQSVHSSVAHHISGTVYRVIIIFGAHV